MSRKPEPRATPASGDLLRWYDRHRRDLPWRMKPGAAPDPYRVWLSEIMLQQTTVKTVGPYYAKFLDRWPTVAALANADEEEVMRAWAGLGYYARARNLHACAKAVLAEWRGVFPDNEDDLRTLPGIGGYTAAAIAAIAFDRRAAAVDGNVERVIARLFAIETPLPQAKPRIKERMLSLVPEDRPGDFTQAMMDLGAGICTPRNPACALCPWTNACAARAQGIAERLPAKAPKKSTPVRFGAAFVAEDAKGRVFLRARPKKGLLGGMLETPTSEWNGARPEGPDAAPFAAGWKKAGEGVVHTFTHFRLELDVYHARVARPPRIDGRWVAPADLDGEALPTLFRKVLAVALGR